MQTELVPLCRFCQTERVLEVADWWPEERAFTLNTCCEGYYEAMLEEFGDAEATRDRDWQRGFADWFEAETGYRPRQCFPSSSEGRLRLDYGLEVREISLADAKAFVAEHHRHNRPPCGWRWGHAIWNGHQLIGVAMVGRPVARRIDSSKVVEVNRVCVRTDVDPELAWNACSMLYGAAAKEAKRRGFERVITYTLESEPATTLKAVGWERAALTKGGTWNRPSRARADTAPTCRKVRWERRLRRAA